MSDDLRRPSRAGRRRRELLTSTGDVIAARGFAGARFTDVARSTGTSVSTLQYLFGSREDLLVAALRQRTEEFIDSALAVIEAVPDPQERLRVATRTMLGADDDAALARREWLVWIEYWHTAMRDEELRKESAATYRRWTQILLDCLDALVATGRWLPPADPRQVATTATAMLDGVGLQFALGHRVSRARAAQSVYDYLMSQLQPTGPSGR